MTTELTLEQAINGFTGLVDELTYSCYRYNRLRSPDITPERWSKIFSNIDTLEYRFQREASHVQATP